MQNPLIIDLGTGFLKYGYPDQAMPTIMPAYLGNVSEIKGDSYLTSLDPTRIGKFFPLENGNLPDSEVLKPLILEVFDRMALGGFQRVATELQLLVFSTVEQNRVYEVCDGLREQLGCRKLLAAYQQVLTLLFLGKHTGMVVDIGHTVSMITPIYQGFLLREHVVDTVTGSLYVTAALRRLLEDMARSSANYSDYAKIATDPKAIEYIKQNFCQVRPNPKDKKTPREWQYRRKGLKVSLGTVTWSAPEVLFDPSLIGIGDMGLIDAVVESIEQTDMTIRRELSNDIVLTGGGSLFLGLRERFEYELKRRLPHLPINVYALEDALTNAWSGAAALHRTS
jgi:actin-related protein